MLVDFEYLNGNLICSYVNKKGNIKLRYYPWQRPKNFFVTSNDDPQKHEKYVTWDGKAVKEATSRHPNKYASYYFIDDLPEDEKEMLFEYNEPNIFFVDIETKIGESKPIPHLAEQPVLCISIVNKNKALVLGVDALTPEEIKDIEHNINQNYGALVGRTWEFKYNCYKSEYELLYNFFKEFLPQMAVVTGWNYIDFDHVYLINRFRNIGGDPTVISPTKNLRKAFNHNKDAGGFNNKDVREMPAHKLIIDYMELYKKWDQSIKIKESNDLNFVAGAILGEKFGKVSYMGDLKHLYATDKKNFMFYNVIDSVLVQLIHEKTKLIDILYGIGTLARICVNNAFSTLAVTEGFLREQMRAEKNIIFVRPSDDDGDDDMAAVEGSVSGGFVLNPIKGMSEYTMCYDFSSLYPTTMRQLNISTDSYKGQLPMLKNKRGELVPDFTSKKCKFNNHDIDVEPTDIKLLNGAVFVNEDGIVVQQITKIFLDRKKYKNMMQGEHEKLEDLKKLRTELEQYVIK